MKTKLKKTRKQTRRYKYKRMCRCIVAKATVATTFPSVEIKANQLFTRDFVFVCTVVFLSRLSEEYQCNYSYYTQDVSTVVHFAAQQSEQRQIERRSVRKVKYEGLILNIDG